jgi:hypothetical protein
MNESRFDEITEYLEKCYYACNDKKKRKDILDYMHVVERNKYPEKKDHRWW